MLQLIDSSDPLIVDGLDTDDDSIGFEEYLFDDFEPLPLEPNEYENWSESMRFPRHINASPLASQEKEDYNDEAMEISLSNLPRLQMDNDEVSTLDCSNHTASLEFLYYHKNDPSPDLCNHEDVTIGDALSSATLERKRKRQRSPSTSVELYHSETFPVSLEQLRQLNLISRLDWSFPLKAATKVLQKATLLTSVSFHSIAFEGDKRDFEKFVCFLRYHSALEEIHFVDCCLIDQSIPIDSLFMALASIPTLETVEIYAMDLERETNAVSLFSPSSIAALCRSPSIISLSFEDQELKDDHIKEMAAALTTNDTLKYLTLWDCNITDTGGQMLADMLMVNTSIQKIDISCNDLRDASFKAIAKAICQNTSMTYMSLHGNTHLLEEDRGVNSGYEAIVEVLKNGQNQTLQEIMLDTADDPTVSFYLAINQNHHLLEDENITRGDLVQCFSENNSHLSFMYYLLKQNPEVCSVDR